MTDEDMYNSLKLLIETKDYYADELPDENFWNNFLKLRQYEDGEVKKSIIL